MSCIKYIVFAVNFLFFILGAAAVGLGIYALVDKNDMSALTKIDTSGKLDEFNGVGLLQSGAIVLIVGGAFLLLLGFFGCCGAIKESRCLLGIYAAVIIIIVIIQIAAAGLAIAFKGRIEDYLQKGLKEGITKNYNGSTHSDNAFSRAFDFAQVYFSCCGVVDAKVDFEYSPWYNRTRNQTPTAPVVPETCCELVNTKTFYDDNTYTLKNPNCTTIAISAGNPHTNAPCYTSVRDWISNKAAIIIGIAIGIVVLEILAVVFAICLCKAIGYETIA